MTALQELLRMLKFLSDNHFSYTVDSFRANAISVSIAVPGERWEVELFDDGNVELECFKSTFVEPRDNIDQVIERLKEHL